MTKRKHVPDSCKELSTNMFVLVWDFINELQQHRGAFVLSWLLKNENVLCLLVNTVLALDFPAISRVKFLNGYNNCKTFGMPLFSHAAWLKIDGAILNSYSMFNVPKPLRKFVWSFRSLDIVHLRRFRAERENLICGSKFLSTMEFSVSKVARKTVRALTGCVLGDIPNFEKKKDGKFRFSKIPSSFIKMKCTKNVKLFFDYSGKQPILVAVLLVQQVLSSETMSTFRLLMIELYSSHSEIVRGHGKKAWQSCMTGFGPFYHKYSKGGNLVLFYTHKQKLVGMLGKSSAADEFEKLVDRFAHADLVDIILSLYMWWCPQVLETFFLYSHPYLSAKEYDASSFDSVLGHGPPAYQLFISKDYCVETYVDTDSTELTLCYASHPNSSISPIDFVLPEYGFRLPVKDGDLFAFRSDVVHGTTYRVPTGNAAYVGAVTVNRQLDQLMVRMDRS